MILTQLVNKIIVKSTVSIAKYCLKTMSTSTLKPPGFFLGSGQPLTKAQFYSKMEESKAPVIMIGENHSDDLAHALELELLKKLSASSSLKPALSLEFYDRESQTVLNEYLRDLVSLDTFLADSKPPANHGDYQPLVDFCKENQFSVIAANCPRRYTRMVSKGGRDCITPLANTSACNLLPPLPYAGASEKYTKNFIDIMRSMGNTNPSVPTTMLDAQSLWDATMADSIHKALDKVDRVIHVTGYFHIQYKLGLVEHLARLVPENDIFTVVILPSEETQVINEEQKGIADLIVLTDIEAL